MGWRELSGWLGIPRWSSNAGDALWEAQREWLDLNDVNTETRWLSGSLEGGKTPTINKASSWFGCKSKLQVPPNGSFIPRISDFGPQRPPIYCFSISDLNDGITFLSHKSIKFMAHPNYLQISKCWFFKQRHLNNENRRAEMRADEKASTTKNTPLWGSLFVRVKSEKRCWGTISLKESRIRFIRIRLESFWWIGSILAFVRGWENKCNCVTSTKVEKRPFSNNTWIQIAPWLLSFTQSQDRTNENGSFPLRTLSSVPSFFYIKSCVLL